MNALLVMPLAIPLVTGVLTLLARHRQPVQHGLSVLGSVGLLMASGTLAWHVQQGGVLVAEMGGWPAPLGIVLVVDGLSAAMLCAAALAGLAVVVYALGDLDSEHQEYGFHPLVHLLLMGVCGAFITGDLFNLYVWFEVLLIASFVLLVMGNTEAQLDGSVKYVAINMISSVAFLSAIGLLYGATGTLNMADVAGRVQEIGLRGTGLEAGIASLFLIGFGIKAALFPLFFWMPAAYHTPPTPVGAIFAGLLTKVGIYSLLRLFTLVFVPAGFTQTVLLWVAGFTMVVGVLGALVERDVQRFFAFLVVSAMGYMLMGLAFYTELGLSGAVFYAVQDIVVKTTLFLMTGVMIREAGARRLENMGGLYSRRPVLAFCFLVPAFSLAGFPPFPGFWGKITLLRAGFEAGYPVLVAVALVVGLLTLLAVAQFWARAFWQPAAEDTEGHAVPALMNVPVIGLAVLLLALGLYAGPLYDWSARAAVVLFEPAPYIQAVLGS